MKLPAKIALYLQASIMTAFLVGSSAPTPLYSIYQSEWHFSPITVTVIFGIYAFAVLLALLVAGSLSDFIGRRPVLLATLVVQVIAMLVFINAHNVATLITARIIQGLSTGATAGAVGAGMLDIDRKKGTLLNASAPILGTGLGGLLAGILVQFLPAPTQLVYQVLIAIFAIQFIGVLFMRETVQPKPGALSSLKVELRLPQQTRKAIAIATPALISVWSLGGFYGALSPSIVRVITGSTSHVLAGLGLALVAITGSLAVFAGRNASPRALITYGTSANIIGIGIVVASVHAQAITPFFIGTFIAGTGFGPTLQGAIRTVIPLTLPTERASVLSVIYVISYLALGLPAVIAGYFVVHGGLITTAEWYGAATMLLSAIPLMAISLRPANTETSMVAG